MVARPARVVALVVLVLLLAGCGGKKSSQSSALASLPGAKVFASAGCGGCHTLQAAKSKGTVGPDLDQLRPDAQTVERQVRNGGVGMPSFSKKLNEVQISQVAEFVSESTRSSTMGGSVAAGFKPDDTKIADCKADDFHCYEQAFANISYKDSPKTALDLFDHDIKTPGPDRARLPPDRPRDRRRGALTLPRQHRPGVRRRPPELHLRLLPRHPRTRLPRSRPEPARRQGAQVLREPGSPQVRVHRLPVRPRPRTRADDLHGLRPAPVPAHLRQAPAGRRSRAARAACSWRTTSRRTASSRAG